MAAIRISCVALMLWVGFAPAASAAAGPAARASSVLVPELPTRATPDAAALGEAKRAYEAANRRFGAGDLSGALGEAELAYRALPNASTALARATILAELDRPRDAFELLLVAADLDPTADERTLIEAGLSRQGAACAPPLHWVRLAVTAPRPAAVTVDGVAVAVPRTLGLTAGGHRLRASAPGALALDTVLDPTTLGESHRAAFELRAVPASSDAPPPSAAVDAAAPPQPNRLPGILGWSLVGGGVALLAVGGGMHAWAAAAADDTERYAAPIPNLPEDTRRQRFEQANDDMKLRGTVAYVCYGLGGAAAVAGATLLVLDATRPELFRVGSRSRGGALRVPVVPAAAPGGAGLVWRGAF